MALAGMAISRVNFSHAKKKQLLSIVENINFIKQKYRLPLKMLGDLQGHRVRLGNFAGSFEVKKGSFLYLSQKSNKDKPKTISFDYPGSLNQIKKGSRIFIDDGSITLEVVSHSSYALKTRAITGGTLKKFKGVNIPETNIDFGKIKSKDIADINFCKQHKFDYIAQSFVCKKSDVLEVKEILGKKSKIKVFAKIENREGLKNIDEIIKISDGIIVARGDMGVCLPIYKIPLIQKEIIRKCNLAKKPVAVATQMLESMIENLRPTRAEVTDVANAIIDGANFVMLSAETATGKHPVEAVKMMNDIIRYTEKNG